MSRVQVVGRACRLPGAPDIESYWDLLVSGRSSVTKVPSDRFAQSWYQNARRGEPGKAYTFAAGIIDDVWGFDPAVFGITPREARQMDPQQRIILQLVWEALEDAGVPPSTLSGRNIGVYVGASSMDHSHRQFFDPAGTDSYLMTGNTLSLIANRVSYIFNLTGPSLLLDTACSSSLVAVDYAIQDLQAGRIDAAIVGGVNTLLSPFNFMGFCAASMLSPDGLCRPFDHRANGYVRSEGGVVMVLQRADSPTLTMTQDHGSIVACAMNSDGRTPGVALPSSQQQAALLAAIYQGADLDPERLAFVEAHGTGTLVGDPAEANALGDILGRRRKQPLPIGSAKSNVGHLEPASGLVGLLKAQLALEHRLLPPTLHVEKLNPHIPFDDLNLRVATDPVELGGTLANDTLAGVNNFGFGGTNVHVVIAPPENVHTSAAANATKPVVAATTASPALSESIPTQNILMLSANCRNALSEMAKSYRARIDADAPEPGVVGRLANAAFHRREQMRERVVILGNTGEDIAGGLAAFVDGQRSANVMTGSALGHGLKTVFVFSGNGSQWDGMGRLAFEQSATFRQRFRDVAERYQRLSDVDLEELLFADDLAERLAQAEFAQPLLFAIQVALTSALVEAGLRPTAAIGHSVGEVAAAYMTGALDLDEAVAVVRARSQHQRIAKGRGLMAAVQASADDVTALIRTSGFTSLDIAANNSPRSVTITGASEELVKCIGVMRKKGIAAKALDIDYPFHSKRLDPVRAPLLASLGDIGARASTHTLYSTVTGDAIEGESLDAEYWWNNVRRPVLFQAAVRSAVRDGYQVFIEIGPRSVLRNYISDTCADADLETIATGSLEKNDPPEHDPVSRTLARAMATGAAFDAETVFGPPSRDEVPLPHYPWQNAEYRLASSPEALDTFNTAHVPHLLAGMQLRPDDWVWENHLDTLKVPFLDDHRVGGKPIMPGAAFVETALSAAAHCLATDEVELRDVDFVQALELSATACQEMRTRVDRESTTIEITSRPRLSGDPPQANMRTRYGRPPGDVPPETVAPERTAAPDARPIDEIYRLARKFGLQYGPSFQRVAACREIGEWTIEVELTEPVYAGDEDFLLHPVDLDSCFHGLNTVYERLVFGENKLAYVPIRIGALRLYRPRQRVRTCRIHLHSFNTRSVCADFDLFDGDGALIATARDVRFRASALVHHHNLRQAAYHIAHEVHPLAHERFQSAALSLEDLTAALATKTPQTAGDDERTAQEAVHENELLLDVAARRVAFDVVSALAASDGLTFDAPHGGLDLDVTGSKASLSNAQQTVVRCLLSVLEDADLVSREEGTYRLPDYCPLPQLSDIVQTITQHDPAWSSECVLLLRANQYLASWLTRQERGEDGSVATALRPATEIYSAATLEHFQCDAPAARKAIDEIAGTMRQALRNWPEGRPLRVLQLGVRGGGLSRALLPMIQNELGRLVVADTDDVAVRRLSNQLSGEAGFEAVAANDDLDALTKLGPFDFVVSASGLHQLHKVDAILANLNTHLADGAIAIISERDVDVFHDVVFGATPDWLDPEAAQGFYAGRLRDRSSWRRSLTAAGFAQAEADDDTLDGLILAQRSRPAGAPLASQGETSEIESAPERDLVLITSERAPEVTLSRAIANALTGSAMAVTIDVRHTGHREPVNGHHKPAVNDNLHHLRDHRAPDVRFELAADPARPVDLVHIALAADQDITDPVNVLSERIQSLRNLLESIGERTVRLWIVAIGGARGHVGRGGTSAVQAGIWSFGRTVMNEYGNIDVRLVDFDVDLTTAEAGERFAALISEPGDLTEIVLSKTAAFGLQVRSGPRDEPLTVSADDRIAEPDGKTAAVLEIGQLGQLDQLAWIARDRRAPKGDEVEIEVVATGLNFRDVMWSLGLLPEEALEGGFAGPTVGFECSGRVLRVGPDATNLNPGDPVIAMAPSGFASHVTVTSQAVARLPDNIPLIDAASIPVAFLTASYALDYLARLRAGEWVLIHGAAGGVGLAALQIAKRVGARVIATAGTEEKRAFVASLGADHVLNSRSLDFADDVRALVPKGVDVVLNSLAGEAMERSIELLRPFGRFLELGKRDFYANTKIGLRPFRRNVSYFGIDADQLLTHDPEIVRDVFADLMQGFADGTLTPLPHRVFPCDQVKDAFRLMQKSGHIGKILVTAPDVSMASDAETSEFTASPAGAQIIVGGTGGFGLEMARWLADRGAQHIVLTSRSGGGADLEALARDLAPRNIELDVVRCDVTDEAALQTMLDDVRAKRPIAGIAHVAMVLDDGLIRDLTPDRVTAVLAPKVEGARHLDRLTRDDDPDYFILFSSAAALFGNPGQGSYNTANGFLDGIARTRREAGLKATAVAWGAISDVGILTRQKDTAESLARHTGGVDFAAQDGLNLLAQLLVRRDADAASNNVALAAVNWALAADVLPIMKTPTYGLIRKGLGTGDQQAGARFDVHAAIQGLDDIAARGVLASYLAKEIAAIFRMPVEDINVKRSLADIGMDSLMGLELRMAAQRGLGVEIPMVSIADGTTINDIAARIVARLRGGATDDADDTVDKTTMMNKHLETEVDDSTLAELEETVTRYETGLQRIV